MTSTCDMCVGVISVFVTLGQLRATENHGQSLCLVLPPGKHVTILKKRVFGTLLYDRVAVSHEKNIIEIRVRQNKNPSSF